VWDLLERVSGHRTAHPTQRRTILDVLDGGAPSPAGPLDELSEAELRVARCLPSNLRAPEIAAELFVSTNTAGRTCATSTESSTSAVALRPSNARGSSGFFAPSHRRR
jgi:hypothetical protein